MTTRGRGNDAIVDPAVAAVFEAYPAKTRSRIMRLRRLVLDTAAATAGVGPIEETLKWGQPSYLTPVSKSGTTIRLDAVKGEPGGIALYVPCQTSLVATFRTLYPEALRYEGDRAIIFAAGEATPVEPLRHCIALALTYHSRKRTGDAAMVRRPT